MKVENKNINNDITIDTEVYMTIYNYENVGNSLNIPQTKTHNSR